MNNYFKQAGDLETKNTLVDNINKYLVSIVSGKRYESTSEFGNVISAGSIIVSINKLKEMVDEGCYNFISAKYINPQVIEIEFQCLDKGSVKRR